MDSSEDSTHIKEISVVNSPVSQPQEHPKVADVGEEGKSDVEGEVNQSKVLELNAEEPNVLHESIVHPPDPGDVSCKHVLEDDHNNELKKVNESNNISTEGVRNAEQIAIIQQENDSQTNTHPAMPNQPENAEAPQKIEGDLSVTQDVPETVISEATQTDPASTLSLLEEELQEDIKPSGLSLIAAEYDSDTDSDEVCEVPSTQTYQNRFVEIDSDSSSSDVEFLSEARSPIDLSVLEAGHGEEDDEENVRTSRSPKVKGEFHLDDLPPIQDLHITVPEEECTELGKIQSIIEQLVIVNSLPGTIPLDLETVLFLDKGKQVLGEIFDVLGQVSDPLYCVRFNSNKDVKEKGIEVGQTVYVAPRTQHTQFIVLANLMKVRGSDASWENDIEPPERFLDYSDDEEERTARRSLRNKNRPMDTDDEGPKRQRAGEPSFPNCGVYPPQRPYRGNYYGSAVRPPSYQHPSNYNIAGNSWHSNFYPNYVQPHQQYRMPVHPPTGYRTPPPNMSQRAPAAHPGLVINPYAVFPPPQLMQQPLFPPPPQQPPPPPPGSF